VKGVHLDSNAARAEGAGATRLFLFAGGGTGGHLYPGLAIAERLHELMGERARCVFVCSDRAIDREILSHERAVFEVVRAKPLAISPRGLARFMRGWGPSVRRGRELIRAGRELHGRDSVQVVAMGGFVAAPIVQAARVDRCPVTLVNLDAAPGKANRLMARRVARAFTTFPVDGLYAKAWVVVPPIVRAAAMVDCTQVEARARLGLDPARPVLMVTGGSQGAGSINDLMAALASDAAPARTLRSWQVLHQTGQDDNARLERVYRDAGVEARVEKFVREIGLWWRAAEAAVSRAGAGSVAEAWASRTPTVFMPYPWHADQHQRLNAAILERAGAAVVVTDYVDSGTNRGEGGAVLMALLEDASRREGMRQAARVLGPVDGASRVAAALAERG
jgi:UDP-N-acetylglucosamine--N-acetylmuramyl-(pentapeptide) pyrophosphoryl-undecaprenol N-acetylglucosamine transferase